MVINLKDKVIPRNEKGDPRFYRLGFEHVTDHDVEYGKLLSLKDSTPTLLEVFSSEEITELVNRALYQIEYQKASHRKRGQEVRDRDKAIKAALKAQGVDVKGQEVKDQLEGKK